MMRILLFILIFFSFCGIAISQVDSDIIYTRSFTNKLRHHQIDFFQPVERWLNISNLQEDEFMSYDAVLHDESDLEIRIRILEDDKAYIKHPHIEVMRMLSSIATNNQESSIRISQINPEWVTENYQADWALYADFEPKESFSRYPKARLLCIYKEGRALVSYIVLHNEDELDPYFEMPLAFLN